MMNKFIIKLPPVSKKNSQQILFNPKTGKRFIAPSKKYKEYLVNCQRYIKMYKSMAKDRLSSKERVLVFLSGNMVQILFYLYKRNA